MLAAGLVTGPPSGLPWGASGQAQAAGGEPLVVELYTSQGCSSCPPADVYLGELVRRDDVIALSFHVTYWDYIGWKDPFASPESTDRQRAYAKAMGQPYVYTPQMVIDGRAHEVGSKRSAVERRLEAVKSDRGDRLDVHFSRDENGQLSVTVPAAAGRRRAAVWMVLFDKSHTTKIRRGENRGRSLTYYNVVRRVTRIGTWEGAEKTIPITVSADEMAARDGCVIIVQEEALGPILGAALVPLN